MKENCSIGSCIHPWSLVGGSLVPGWWNYLGWIWRYGLVGGDMSLGVSILRGFIDRRKQYIIWYNFMRDFHLSIILSYFIYEVHVICMHEMLYNIIR